MKARLRADVIIHFPLPEWVATGQAYEAEWSQEQRSPRRVVLIHPDRPDTFCELPFRAVEVL